MAQAERYIDEGAIDLAIVDYHVSDGNSEELMQRLHDAGVPFIISSGWADAAERFPKAPLLSKPFSSVSLVDALLTLPEATQAPDALQ